MLKFSEKRALSLVIGIVSIQSEINKTDDNFDCKTGLFQLRMKNFLQKRQIRKR